MDIVIRDAMGEDIDTIVEISKCTIRACYTVFLGEEMVKTYVGSHAIRTYTREHLNGMEVITVDGEIAGFCVCKVNLID